MTNSSRLPKITLEMNETELKGLLAMCKEEEIVHLEECDVEMIEEQEAFRLEQEQLLLSLLRKIENERWARLQQERRNQLENNVIPEINIEFA